MVDLVEAAIDFFEAMVNLVEAAVDLFEAMVNLVEAMVDVLGEVVQALVRPALSHLVHDARS
jgi:hypothetical protein